MKSVMIGNRTGGQGKTLVAQVLAVASLALQAPYHTVAVDVPPGNTKVRSKLGLLLPQTQEIAISAETSDVLASGAAIFRHFDKLGSVLRIGGSVIDTGANVLPAILEWIDHIDADFNRTGMFHVDLIVPATAQATALSDAHRVLIKSLPFVTIERRILLFNFMQGKPDRSAKSPMDRLENLARGEVIEIVRFNACESKLLPLLEAKSIPLLMALMLSDEQTQHIFGLSKAIAAEARAQLHRWFWQQVAIFQHARLLPLRKF